MSLSVLIVDDNEQGRRILCHNFNWHGYRILEASHGREALGLAIAEPVDLIVSDVLMPVMDGFQLLREIRKRPELSSIPFIFYSSVYVSAREQELALALGARAFIVKPLSAGEFWEEIIRIQQEDVPAAPCKGSLSPSDEEYISQYSQIVTAKLEEKIQELEAANQQIRQSESRYRNLFASMRDVAIIADLSRTVVDANQPALRTMFGYETEEVLGKSTACFYDDPGQFELAGKEIVNSDDANTGTLLEVRFRRKSGEAFDGELCVQKMRDDTNRPVGNIGIIRDITERKRAEQEHEKVQLQLHQAQKMESIGRLAGGVAHDFNNMLGVILGYAEIAMQKINPDDSLYDNIQEIFNAGKRSAAITQQLLAFARKQTIAPKVLDLNEMVGGMLKLLQSLIGEDINLAWCPGFDLYPVKIDPSQLDQILANLCVNARDAITGVGKVTIETRNVTVDAAYCADHAGFIPGNFVLLAISDDGCGMDKETLGRLFEPFFTTKAVGKGTGLGLAMVYGIVKQNKGFINVYSEPGQGTTFKMYLSAYLGETDAGKMDSSAAVRTLRRATILVVEDEVAILKLTRIMLERLGCTVLTAGTPHEALDVARQCNSRIDLLLTDVVMPEMSGKELSDRLRAICPGLKILFMSGYTANVIAHRGILDDGILFIQKPFSRQDLTAKIREALGKDCAADE